MQIKGQYGTVEQNGIEVGSIYEWLFDSEEETLEANAYYFNRFWFSESGWLHLKLRAGNGHWKAIVKPQTHVLIGCFVKKKVTFDVKEPLEFIKEEG